MPLELGTLMRKHLTREKLASGFAGMNIKICVTGALALRYDDTNKRFEPLTSSLRSFADHPELYASFAEKARTTGCNSVEIVFSLQGPKAVRVHIVAKYAPLAAEMRANSQKYLFDRGMEADIYPLRDVKR
ncbi:hypothetical protein HZB07_07600 [Candidatus Saganbacteria bacterium]|nr:hypothetical protein [Candidatus Saganbacteria bacterium]